MEESQIYIEEIFQDSSSFLEFLPKIKLKLQNEEWDFIEKIVDFIKMILENDDGKYSDKFKLIVLKFLKDAMEMNKNHWTMLIQNKIIESISLYCKPKLNQSISEIYRSLSALSNELLSNWARIYGGKFNEIYEKIIKEAKKGSERMVCFNDQVEINSNQSLEYNETKFGKNNIASIFKKNSPNNENNLNRSISFDIKMNASKKNSILEIDQKTFDNVYNDLFHKENMTSFKKSEKIYLEKLKIVNEETMLNFVLVSAKILKMEYPPLIKQFALKFIKDGMDMKLRKFVFLVEQNVLPILYELSKSKIELSVKNRGKFFFDSNIQKIGMSVYSTILECIKIWASWYYYDSTLDFKKIYNDLLLEKIEFPEAYSHFLDFEFLESQIQIIRKSYLQIIEILNLSESEEIIIKKLESSFNEISKFVTSSNIIGIKLIGSDLIMTSEERKIYQDYLDGMNILNQFDFDFKNFIDNKLSLSQFKEDYSMESTFKMSVVNKKKIELLNSTKEKFENLLDEIFLSEKNYSQNHLKLVSFVSANALEKIDQIIQKIDMILKNSSDKPISFFLALKLVKDCMYVKNPYFIDKISTNILFSFYSVVKNQKKGKNLFGENLDQEYQKIGEKCYQLALESIIKWADWFPIDQKGKTSEFKEKFQLILSSNIKIPQIFEFYTENEMKDSCFPRKMNSMNLLNLKSKILHTLKSDTSYELDTNVKKLEEEFKNSSLENTEDLHWITTVISEFRKYESKEITYDSFKELILIELNTEEKINESNSSQEKEITPVTPDSNSSSGESEEEEIIQNDNKNENIPIFPEVTQTKKDGRTSIFNGGGFRASFLNTDLFKKNDENSNHNISIAHAHVSKLSSPKENSNATFAIDMASPFNQINSHPCEVFSKSFKSIIENNENNEKLALRTSMMRRKTSEFGKSFTFLNGVKPKISRKKEIVNLSKAKEVVELSKNEIENLQNEIIDYKKKYESIVNELNTKEKIVSKKCIDISNSNELKKIKKIEEMEKELKQMQEKYNDLNEEKKQNESKLLEKLKNKEDESKNILTQNSESNNYRKSSTEIVDKILEDQLSQILANSNSKKKVLSSDSNNSDCIIECQSVISPKKENRIYNLNFSENQNNFKKSKVFDFISTKKKEHNSFIHVSAPIIDCFKIKNFDSNENKDNSFKNKINISNFQSNVLIPLEKENNVSLISEFESIHKNKISPCTSEKKKFRAKDKLRRIHRSLNSSEIIDYKKNYIPSPKTRNIKSIFNKKKSKFRGKIYNTFPHTIEDIVLITNQKINEFKFSCLNSKSILFEDSIVQIGETNEQIIRNGSLFIKIIIFIKNKTNQNLIKTSIEYCSEFGISLWIKPLVIKTIIEPKEQIKQELVINYKSLPYSLLLIDFSFTQNNYDDVITLSLPITFHKFFEWKDQSIEELKNKWNIIEDESILKSERLWIDNNIVKNPNSILNYFSLMKPSNSQIKNKKNKLSFFGQIYLRSLDKYYLLKLVFYNLNNLIIKVGGAKNNDEEDIKKFLLYNLCFILCHNIE